ncbi:NAD(P)-binding protein [Sinanaerobacter sp. ZZT-01]|uniref:NAD(P)-binding protein n=1 Tax=Sinanaerobacter sp. ZZT-01 TaxID=3111540 RepID=UPI002D78588D|nr:NAD(P)-binding protein [Sinanaerobacter sp. ZZT-01]WRR92809.1 NAD(P)-binding protein [Sinanaerobacter sp. ZZT-01]
MSRLDIKTRDRAQTVVEGLYKDLERRIIASPPGLCPVDMASSFLKLCHAQTCGKCVPCRVGLGQLEHLLDDVLDLSEDTDLEIISLIERTAKTIRDSADCAIGTEAANMVLRGLYGFREDYMEHVTNNRCVSTIQNLKQPVPCVALCPAEVDIPGYISLVLEDRCEDAIRLIRKDNPFPTVCALICEHPCEARCRRNLIDAPINIRGMKRYAVDHCGKVEVPKRMEDTEKKVAIIGGGPSGLSAAYFLSLMGHQVTVFEKRTHLGGMLRYGIPSYRLPRERLQEDIDAILSTGVEIKIDSDIGSEDSIQKLRDEYDAVYISIGAHTHKTIGIEGEYSRGVISAVEILRSMGDDTMPDFKDKQVVVIGGGNVAMDVARTAKRLGAKKVSIVYRRRRQDMTALSEEIEGAIAEGCELLDLKAPSRIESTKEGDVESLYVKPQIAGKADKAGRPKPMDAQAKEECIPCEIIISAIGQATDSEHFEQYGIPINRGNIVAARSSGIESIPGIFAGGDCVSGPSTVINAVAAGKVAAANIDSYLGYHHMIECDIEIPAPRHGDHPPCARVEMKERLPGERGGDFSEIEKGMTEEEAKYEALRCLRCDHYGLGVFKGGRVKKW